MLPPIEDWESGSEYKLASEDQDAESKAGDWDAEDVDQSDVDESDEAKRTDSEWDPQTLTPAPRLSRRGKKTKRPKAKGQMLDNELDEEEISLPRRTVIDLGLLDLDGFLGGNVLPPEHQIRRI